MEKLKGPCAVGGVGGVVEVPADTPLAALVGIVGAKAVWGSWLLLAAIVRGERGREEECGDDGEKEERKKNEGLEASA